MKSLTRSQRAFRIAAGWSGGVLASAADLAKGYPIELRTVGTLQALAFSMGKREAAHTALTEAIAAWVLSNESGAPLGAIPEEQRSAARLLQLLAEAPLVAYLAADSEAIAFADALKLMAQAFVKSSAAAETPGPAAAGSANRRRG